MRRVRRCVRTGGHPRLAVGTTLTPPWVHSATSSPHGTAAAPVQGRARGHRRGGHHRRTAQHRAPQSRQERARAPLWWLWQKVRQPRTLVPCLLCWIPGNLAISTRIWRHRGGSTLRWACQRPRGTLQPASTLVAAMTSH